MKARFTTQQPAVSWQPLDNGLVDVSICLNGQEVTVESSQVDEFEQIQTTTETFWEYDFHQFRESTENIDQSDVESYPETYLDYTPVKSKSLEEQVQEQSETISMLMDCLLEVSELVYA